MRSWHEFITMGGYAIYVWPAFGLGLIVLAAHVIEPVLRRRHLLRRLAIEHSLGGGARTAKRQNKRDA